MRCYFFPFHGGQEDHSRVIRCRRNCLLLLGLPSLSPVVAYPPVATHAPPPSKPHGSRIPAEVGTVSAVEAAVDVHAWKADELVRARPTSLFVLGLLPYAIVDSQHVLAIRHHQEPAFTTPP